MGREWITSRVWSFVSLLWPLVSLLGAVSAVVMLGSLGSNSLDRVVITMTLNLILVVGLYVFVGNSGVLSFGHMAFMAIGAYTGALVTIPSELKDVLFGDAPAFIVQTTLSPIPATLLGGGIAAAVALVLAVPLMRMSGLMAGLGTFAVLLIANVIAVNWRDVTRGTNGVSQVPITTTTTTALIWALLMMIVAYAFQVTNACVRLRASREDVPAAKAVGIHVSRERTVAWVISAFIVGIGGALYGQYVGSFNPDAFYLSITLTTLAMLVIGGMRSLAGAVVGVVVVSTIGELLRRGEVAVSRPGLEELGIAAFLLGVLILRPRGITGSREVPWVFKRQPARHDGKARSGDESTCSEGRGGSG